MSTVASGALSDDVQIEDCHLNLDSLQVILALLYTPVYDSNLRTTLLT